MTEFTLHVCPLCIAPVQVEGGYDGPYYEWTCDHQGLVSTNYGNPETMSLAEWGDPARREALRSKFCLAEWRQLHADYREHKRPAYDEADHSRLRHPTHKDTPHYFEWTPEYRRERKWWRDNGGTTSAFNAILKDTWRRPIMERLMNPSPFLDALNEEHIGAATQAHADINRQAYGEQVVIPLRKSDT